MIGFFEHFRKVAKREGVDEEAIKQFFSGLEGIVLLDTLGEADKNRQEINKLNSGLPVSETKKIGVKKLKHNILEAIERSKEKSNSTKN